MGFSNLSSTSKKKAITSTVKESNKKHNVKFEVISKDEINSMRVKSYKYAI